MRGRSPKVLVTGGAGFIGSEFVRQAVNRGIRIVVLDKLTYAGDLRRLKDVKKKLKFHKTDICHKNRLAAVFKKERPHTVVHFAAETHVDRSIKDAAPFTATNVNGTQNIIDCSLKYSVKKILHISTDEVYGEYRGKRFSETDPLNPSNPYAATKAAAEQLVRAAIRTRGLSAIIIRPTNCYGPWQYPEKLVPVAIVRALKNKTIPVYGRGRQIREWLYVDDCVAAIFVIMKKGKIGATYNIGTLSERTNLATVKAILKTLDRSTRQIRFVRDRPGHDFRYSINSAKLRKLGWKPAVAFTDGIRDTSEWYRRHLNWKEST